MNLVVLCTCRMYLALGQAEGRGRVGMGRKGGGRRGRQQYEITCMILGLARSNIVYHYSSSKPNAIY
jgi:hypothetical protein